MAMGISESRSNVKSIDDLPDECIRNIISFATPGDACRLSAVSSSFKSAAESDDLWEKFLPENYRTTIANSSDPALLNRCSSRKQLYLHLSENPLLVDCGLKSYWLEKSSGKICCMLSARDLLTVSGNTSSDWEWSSWENLNFRFTEFAELLEACWIEIRGGIKGSLLSRQTLYYAYFVFALTDNAHGISYSPLEVSVGHVGVESVKKTIYLGSGSIYHGTPAIIHGTQREDRWYEVELGDFLNYDCEKDIEISLLNFISDTWKRGIILYGTEIRPKNTRHSDT